MTSHTAIKLNLTPAQARTVETLTTNYARCETWREDDGTLGVAFTDDGCRMIGYLDYDGRLIGDWIV